MLPLSWLYRSVTAVRNGLYNRGWLAVMHSRCPVISIGNVTVGGTGKTPMTELIVRRLLKMDHRPAVVSRGYGRSQKGVKIVSDGKRLLMSPGHCGDEPAMLAKRFPSVPVVVAARRYDGVALIEKLASTDYEWECDCIVLDDAFQHRGMARDLDIVLADTIKGFGNGRLLPAGPCREPLSSIGRAHILVMTHADCGSCSGIVETEIRRHSKAPVFHSRHQPREWIQWPHGPVYPLQALAKKRLLAFAGLGNPDGFKATLASLDPGETKMICFRDHHWYSPGDMDRLTALARKAQADGLITTEKDAIRIPDHYRPGIPIYALRIEMEICEPIESLDRFLEGIFHTPE